MIEESAILNKIKELSTNTECSNSDAENFLKLFVGQEDNKVLSKYKEELGGLKSVCTYPNCDACIIKKWCRTYKKYSQEKEKNKKAPTFIDFFCGSGGLSLGFSQEGYKLSLANDIQECCISTFRFNHPEVPAKHIVLGDINTVISEINKLKRYQDTDVVIGGPPCQGFSMANRQRIINDPRNKLYKSFVQAIDILKPKFVVMENVRGILSVFEQIKEDFELIGYKISATLLNAKDFGVPQNRERVIFVGNRMGIDNDMILKAIKNDASHTPKYVLEDALFGLPRLSAKRTKNKTEEEDIASGYTVNYNKSKKTNEYIELINNKSTDNLLIFNHKARYNNPRDIEIFGRLRQGEDSSSKLIEDIMPYKSRKEIFKDKYYKLCSKKPCKTITAHMKYDCNMYIHPEQPRGLTPREAARIQSYPDNYLFCGSYTKTYMQIGNSVPPLLSKTIAKVLKIYLKKGN